MKKMFPLWILVGFFAILFTFSSCKKDAQKCPHPQPEIKALSWGQSLATNSSGMTVRRFRLELEVAAICADVYLPGGNFTIAVSNPNNHFAKVIRNNEWDHDPGIQTSLDTTLSQTGIGNYKILNGASEIFPYIIDVPAEEEDLIELQLHFIYSNEDNQNYLGTGFVSTLKNY